MKKLVGTFRTEEEAILAINDLKDMGLDTHEITVVTQDPYDYNSIRGYDETITPGSLQVGSVYHGEGVNNFVSSLGQYGIPEEKARMYNEGFREGRFLVFIGLDEHIRNHIDNPGSYRAPDLFIDDIETPGTYTILAPHNEDPDTPGMYVAEEYGNRPTNPGTYEDPIIEDEIITPGTYTEDEVIDPPHHMVRNPDEDEADPVFNDRNVEDDLNRDLKDREYRRESSDPFDPDRTPVRDASDEIDPLYRDRNVDVDPDLRDSNLTSGRDPYDPDRTPGNTSDELDSEFRDRNVEVDPDVRDPFDPDRKPGVKKDDEVIYTTKDNKEVTEDDFDPVYNERDLKDRVDPEKVNRNASVDEKDPFDPDRPLF